MKVKNENIDVSIIVPVYNHEKYIEQALESIFNQETEYMYEVLVGEDASLDRSKDVIKTFEKKYPEKIRAFYREKNRGATRNGYELYMKARGRYITCIEGDDYWTDKRKIQKQVRFLDEHDHYIGVACDFSVVDKDGNMSKEKSISKKYLNKEFTWQDFLKRGFEFQTATLMYRNFFLDGKDYSILYRAHDLIGDLTVLTILLNRGDIFVINDVMSAYRKVIDPTLSNACSIAKRDMALAEVKTVRQYTMLKPYLKNESDFNKIIANYKLNFLFQMIKRTEGYTWKRWYDLQHLSGFTTNFLIPVVLFERILNKIKEIGKCQREF